MPRFEEEIQKAVENKSLPGVALLVSKKGEVAYRNFFGTTSLLNGKESLTENHLFDIASLTKPLVPASIALAMKKEGRLKLDTPLSKKMEELQGGDKERITLRHLFKHTSGLPAWKPYFKEIAQERPQLLGTREAIQIYIEKISQETLDVPVAYQRIYSDLGFILLGAYLERVEKKPLDQLFFDRVAHPLGMQKTRFLPNDRLPNNRNDYVATEQSSSRMRLLQGEVHDDNAFAMGGVAGHAGLFSTVDDLHKFLTEIRKGYENKSELFPREIIHDFVGPKVKVKLGWDSPTPNESQSGKYFSYKSVGHLGYTGCSFWIDFEQDFHIILLSNRVHPSSKNEEIKKLRPTLHNLIFEELIAP